LSNRALLKLQIDLEMTSAEREAYLAIVSSPQSFAKGETLIRAGEPTTRSIVLLDGFAARERYTSTGNRQIVSFVIPGDNCDLHTLVLPSLPYSITALTTVTLAYLPHDSLRDLIRRFPRLGYAFWRETLIDASIFQEWLVNVGARPAEARLAHLICELYVRLNAVGMAENSSFVLPMSQINLANATGLSVVHVNRMLQRLKTRRLVESNSQLISVLNWGGLQEVGDFDQGYLYSRVPPQASAALAG
jgi:CRP-like cAMP-binding protein